jgi:hypothetical protein
MTNIEIPITFSGPGATPENIASIKAAVKNAWAGSNFNVNIVDGTDNNISLTLEKTGSYVTRTLFGTRNSGSWGANSDRWVFWHEAGYLMNLKDRYSKDSNGYAVPGSG